jgi:hypothetical protein
MGSASHPNSGGVPAEPGGRARHEGQDIPAHTGPLDPPLLRRRAPGGVQPRHATHPPLPSLDAMRQIGSMLSSAPVSFGSGHVCWLINYMALPRGRLLNAGITSSPLVVSAIGRGAVFDIAMLMMDLMCKLCIARPAVLAMNIREVRPGPPPDSKPGDYSWYVWLVVSALPNSMGTGRAF